MGLMVKKVQNRFKVVQNEDKMIVKEKTKNVINELKRMRLEKGFTYQDIAEKTEANGEAVSLSSIKLVFSDNDKHNHDYNKIIKPIANVLLDAKEDDSDLKSMRAILEYKNELINQLQERLASKDRKHKEREQFLMEQFDFYKEQIAFKDSQIKRLNEAIDRKDAFIKKQLSKEEK